jgi:hypothetical protein
MLTRSQVLFLSGCIPMRLVLAYVAKVLPLKYLPFLGVVTFCIACGFLYLSFTGKRATGAEVGKVLSTGVLQNKPIWWKSLRSLHGLMYLTFSVLAFLRFKKAYLVLLVDTILGLGIFLGHYFTLRPA